MKIQDGCYSWLLRVADRCYKHFSYSIIDWFETAYNEITRMNFRQSINYKGFFHNQQLRWRQSTKTCVEYWYTCLELTGMWTSIGMNITKQNCFNFNICHKQIMILTLKTAVKWSPRDHIEMSALKKWLKLKIRNFHKDCLKFFKNFQYLHLIICFRRWQNSIDYL